jgi:hypothetical protein
MKDRSASPTGRGDFSQAGPGNATNAYAFDFKCLVAEYDDVVASAPSSDGCGFRARPFNRCCVGRSSPWGRRARRRPRSRCCGATGTGNAACRTGDAACSARDASHGNSAPNGCAAHSRAAAHGRASCRCTCAQHGGAAWRRASVLRRSRHATWQRAAVCCPAWGTSRNRPRRTSS